ncbi:hypothetical protein KX816_12410 [Sphingosinicellaceae bacterium]|nr:hypothetical protein KX816_12410 [Sphingosinicellaceae bacterium]
MNSKFRANPVGDGWHASCTGPGMAREFVMPRFIVAAVIGAAILAVGSRVAFRPLFALPDFHPHLAISVSLTL